MEVSRDYLEVLKMTDVLCVMGFVEEGKAFNIDRDRKWIIDSKDRIVGNIHYTWEEHVSHSAAFLDCWTANMMSFCYIR